MWMDVTLNYKEYVLPRVGSTAPFEEFGSCDAERVSTKKEQKSLDSFSSILWNTTIEDLDIECEEDCAIEDEGADPLWEPDDEEELASTSRGLLIFGNVEVSKQQVQVLPKTFIRARYPNKTRRKAVSDSIGQTQRDAVRCRA
ncbi:unnamed protein product [Haemonchus placei]|uniref:Uncharacterized protein n=1 Tax=Haemonchus placei TaxID=6290 RepID=A0A0N4WXS2_HAEPC|nr:unnamed protein product [Haemonchus placei]